MCSNALIVGVGNVSGYLCWQMLNSDSCMSLSGVCLIILLMVCWVSGLFIVAWVNASINVLIVCWLGILSGIKYHGKCVNNGSLACIPVWVANHPLMIAMLVAVKHVSGITIGKVISLIIGVMLCFPVVLSKRIPLL